PAAASWAFLKHVSTIRTDAKRMTAAPRALLVAIIPIRRHRGPSPIRSSQRPEDQPARITSGDRSAGRGGGIAGEGDRGDQRANETAAHVSADAARSSSKNREFP